MNPGVLERYRERDTKLRDDERQKFSEQRGLRLAGACSEVLDSARHDDKKPGTPELFGNFGRSGCGCGFFSND